MGELKHWYFTKEMACKDTRIKEMVCDTRASKDTSII